MDNKPHFHRSLSLLDGALLVIGSMIGSGIFVVSSEMAQSVGSAGWLIAIWGLAGFMTIAGALSFGELSGMFPQAGGQYVYLREAYGKLYGFLYGWSFFAVIQTGTIAAVGVIFARYSAYFFPSLSESHILLDLGFLKISAAQCLSIAIILLLTYINTRGVETGKWIMFIFTFAKVAAISLLVVLGFFFVKDASAWHLNWSDAWHAVSLKEVNGTVTSELISTGGLVVAVGIAMVGALFSSDAWNNVTFIAGEIRRPERNIGLSLFIGTFTVTLLYMLMNLMYTNTLTMQQIAYAPEKRVAIAAALNISLLGQGGAKFIALLIMISTFGCNNGLILSGARVYAAMAKDEVFLPAAKKLNTRGVPARALWMQAGWACLLCLSGQYSQLLDFIIFTVLLFYILTIAAIFLLRKKRPDHPRPYKAFGYPFFPALYILMALAVCTILLIFKTSTTWPGLVIVIIGVFIFYYLESRKKAAGGGQDEQAIS